MTDSLLIKVAAAARHVGVSRAQMYKLLRSGKGPRTCLVGDTMFVRPDDLDAWIASLPERETRHDAA